MTRRGVFHDLSESEYAISNGEIALFFSSRFYLNKFLDEYKEHRNYYRKRISKAMIVDGMNTDLLADVYLYIDIEKRGFRAVKEKSYFDDHFREMSEFKWHELHLFALEKLTSRNTNDWSEIPVLK